MPKLSVCIEMFWADRPYEERIRLAREAGYDAAEFWGWSGKDLGAIQAAAERANVTIATFLLTSDAPLVAPTALESLKRGLSQAAAAAERLGTRRLIVTTGNERKGERFEVTRRTVVRNLKGLIPLLEQHNLTLCVEPLNPIRDHLGYWLTTVADAADVVADVDHPRVRILMDLYHQQVTEGNLIEKIREYLPLIGHFHCAGVPGRGELVGGELDYRSIFRVIDECGYAGYVGLEFKPRGDTAAALAQALDLTR